jgi:hypothetical protein
MTEVQPPPEVPRNVLVPLAGFGVLFLGLSVVSVLFVMLLSVTLTDGDVNEAVANGIGAAIIAAAVLGVLGSLAVVAAISGGKRWILAGLIPPLLLAVPGIPSIRPAFLSYGDLIAIGFCASAAVAYRPARRAGVVLHVALLASAVALFLITPWSEVANGLLAFGAAYPVLACSEELSRWVFRARV